MFWFWERVLGRGAFLAVAIAAFWVVEAKPMESPFHRHIKVAEFPEGLQWINVAHPLELKDLRGKFVLLDFWTYCCINCMHILPELKKVEKAYANELVVIGVHSAKFENERDSRNIRRGRRTLRDRASGNQRFRSRAFGNDSACKPGRR